MPVNADGSAGTAVQIDYQGVPGPTSADGMRLYNHDLLIVDPNNGELWHQVLHPNDTADNFLVSNRLDAPSAVVQIGTELWVTEGQIGTLLVGGNPKAPFLIERVHAP